MYGPKADPNEFGKDKPIYVKNSTLLQNQKEVDPIPHIEWWDEFLLPPGAEQFPQNIRNQDIYLERITHFVQHPVQLKNRKIEQIDKMIMPKVYLTDKEKHRLSRNKRIEKEKEKQEKVKLGLMPAPLPKIKMSNYQKVMAKDAIIDPSGTELIAKAIINKRLEDHLQANLDRKCKGKSLEQKMLRKHLNDQKNEIR